MPLPATLTVADPWTGDTVADVPLMTVEQAIAQTSRASAAQRAWARTGIDERMALCDRFCDVLLRDLSTAAGELTAQLGKPLAQSEDELRRAVETVRHLSSIALEMLVDLELPSPADELRHISHEPVGVVVCAPHWSDPYLLSLATIAPAVLAGNAVLIRTPALAPLTSKRIADAFREAGAPDDLVSVLPISPGTLISIADHPAVGFVAFSGDEAEGRALLASTANASFVDVALELGGNDAAYVSEDADIEKAVEGIAAGAYQNSGQSLWAVDRVYVHQSHYDAFLEALANRVRSLRMGNPRSDATTLGPLANRDLSPHLSLQVEEALHGGGRVVVEGGPTTVEGRDGFFAPVLIADAKDSWSLMRDGSAGPLLGVSAVQGDDEAVARINDSRYGQTVSVWTVAPLRAERLALKLDAGTVFMNRCGVRDPALPWTGRKSSGRGSSLSHWAFASMTKRKSWSFRLS